MKRIIWMGAVISVLFPLAVVLGQAYSSGAIRDPQEYGPVRTQLILAYLPFVQIMIFLVRRLKLSDQALVNGTALTAFLVFAFNGLLWSVPGGSGPGSGANIGWGMLMMVQWTFTYPALLLVERIVRKIMAMGKSEERE